MYLGHVIDAASVSAARSAAIFRALSDEKRLRILGLLTVGELCVCELTEELDLPQPLLSFHLRTLKDAGLVVDRRAGRWVFYSLQTNPLDEARSLLENLSSERGVDPTLRTKASRC